MSDAASNPTPPHSLGFAIEHLRRRWGAFVAFGVLLFVLGVAALIFTLASTVATVTLNGAFFLIAGVAEIGVGAHAKSWGRFFLWLIGGALYLVAGIICIVNPIFASAALTLALGAGLIAAAAVRFYLAFQLPADNRAFVFLAAAVTLLLGLIIVAHWPMDSVYVLGTLLGVDLLFHGASWTAFGFRLRTH
ncbi:MAG: HdeD family acid-resistance protein [Bradyrhizobium sp.]|nr:MAG: HdeD family acid-resistance protein [Bradyrhizobium sp.]